MDMPKNSPKDGPTLIKSCEIPEAIDNIAQVFPDVPYYTDESQPDRRTYDLLVPKHYSPPYPLIIFFHGGGFVGGDKCATYMKFEETMIELLGNGYAFATVNYRYHDDPTVTNGILDSLADCEQAIIHLKNTTIHFGSQVEVFNPLRIGLMGSSAGGMIVLYLGTNHGKPCGYKAIVALKTQATLNIYRWPEILFPEKVFLSGGIRENFMHLIQYIGYFSKMYPYNTFEILQQLVNNLDFLTDIHDEMPPTYIANEYEFQPENQAWDQTYTLHHPAFSAALYEKAKQVRSASPNQNLAPFYVYVPYADTPIGLGPNSEEGDPRPLYQPAEFLMMHLTTGH